MVGFAIALMGLVVAVWWFRRRPEQAVPPRLWDLPEGTIPESLAHASNLDSEGLVSLADMMSAMEEASKRMTKRRVRQHLRKL